MRNFLVALLFLLSAKVSAESLYYIGVVSDQQRASVLQQWLPTAGWLSQKLGHRFAIRVIKPEQLPDMLDEYPVDFLVGSTGSFVRFTQDYDLNSLLNINMNVNNLPLESMGAVFLVRRNRSDLTSLSDVKGKRLMALSDADFGSFHVGWGELHALGINPFDDTTLKFARTQPQQVVFAVRDGLADVGVVKTGVLEAMQDLPQEAEVLTI
jgi:two-component system sensor histidine kinase TtrS